MISYTKLNKLMLIGLVTISVETEVIREKIEGKKRRDEETKEGM